MSTLLVVGVAVDGLGLLAAEDGELRFLLFQIILQRRNLHLEVLHLQPVTQSSAQITTL